MKQSLRTRIGRRAPLLRDFIRGVCNRRTALRHSIAALRIPVSELPPLNGQILRESCVRSLIEVAQPGLIVETGTFRGSSALFFAQNWPKARVVSSENNLLFYLAAAVRCAGRPNLELKYAESASVLEQLAAQPSNRATSFFYLDAHWGADVPLREELRIILRNWPQAIICIDDMHIPGDAGYGYDEYDGVRLDVAYLLLPRVSGLRAYTPRHPSCEETGRRRGTVYILVGDEMIERLRPITEQYLLDIELQHA